MRHILLALTLVVGLAPLALADTATTVRTQAEKGDAKAQFALGIMYRDGRGVAQDYDKALQWWRKAAELGLIDAQYALGNMYAGGSGVERNNVQAYMWYSIAASQKGVAWIHAIARSNRKALEARMAPGDIMKAQTLVTEWKAKHGK